RRVDHDAEGERVRLLRPEIGVADPVRDPRVSYRRLILDRAAVIRRRSLWSHDRFADRLRAGGTLRAVDVCVRVRAEGTVLIILRALVAEDRSRAAELLRPREKELADVRSAHRAVDAAAHAGPRRDGPVDQRFVRLDRAD